MLQEQHKAVYERTLILSVGYEPMLFCSWKKAICLVLSGKAEIIESYDVAIQTLRFSFYRPSVVRLNCFVSLHRFRRVRCNRKNIMLRDKYQCQYCGTQCSASIDHIIPRSQGGGLTWSNAVVACHSCNHKKSDRTPDQAGIKLRRKPRTPKWEDLFVIDPQFLPDAWMSYLATGAR